MATVVVQEGMLAVETDLVGLLHLDIAGAATPGDPQHMTENLGQVALLNGDSARQACASAGMPVSSTYPKPCNCLTGSERKSGRWSRLTPTSLAAGTTASSSQVSRADMLDDLDRFKNLMIWYACEKFPPRYRGRPLKPL